MDFLPGWLQQVAKGNVEVELLPLRLADDAGTTFNGQGFLRWTPNRGVWIEAITDGAAHLLGPGDGTLGTLGSLIPDSHFLRLTASTRAKETVEIDRILRDGSNVYGGNPTVVWKIEQDSICSPVTVRAIEPPDNDPPSTELLLSPVDLHWPRPSQTRYDNPHFGRAGWKQDWLEFSHSGGTVAAHSIGDQMARLRIEHSDGVEQINTNALGLAFSFLCSRVVNLVAHTTRGSGSVTNMLHLRRTLPRRHTFAPPVGDNPLLRGAVEAILSKAADFFLTARGGAVGNLMFACLDSADATFTTHSLVVCVVLESLVKLIAEDRPQPPVLTNEQIEGILKHLEDLNLDPRTVKRFRGFMDRLDAITPKNILHDWSKAGIFGIVQEDVYAWDGLRNPIAHGRLLWVPDEQNNKQHHLRRLWRVKNLINKLLLNLMGYTGPYFDYAAWTPKKFVPTILSAD